jgi:hypothetical protein
MAINKVSQALAPRAPFVWGADGKPLSKEEAEARRAAADRLRAPAGYTPKGWMSLLGSLAGEGVGQLKENEAVAAEKAGHSKVAEALAKARETGDYMGVMSDEWATPQQMTVASALQNRGWQQQDRQAEWSRQDAIRAAEAAKPDWKTIEVGGDILRYNANDPNSRPETFYDGPEKPGYRPMTAEEKAAYNLPPDSPAQIGPDGKVDTIGGGQTINVNTGDGADGALSKALSTKEGESWAAIKDAGMVAGAMGQDLGLLDELIKVAPQGPIIGPLAETFKGFSSAGDAFQSIVKRVAPSLRTPGSGATSDIEYQGFLDSLPALKNSPEGNRLINEIMKTKAAINKQRSDIVTAYQAGAMSVTEARKAMEELNSAPLMTPEMRSAIVGVGGGEPSAGPAVGEVVEGYVFKGGDPANPNSWAKQ